MSKNTLAILSALIGLVIGVGIGFGFLPRLPVPPLPSEPIVCAQDAKQCSDGSYVGRVAPRCDFASCPISSTTTTPPISPDDLSDWHSTTTLQGITYRYPAQLPATYLHGRGDWPPVLTIEAKVACSSPVRLVHGRAYCVRFESEGAAGSTYTTYAYQFFDERYQEAFALRFTIQAVQCANFDPPQAAACLQERQTFDLDGLVDRIFQTIQWSRRA